MGASPVPTLRLLAYLGTDADVVATAIARGLSDALGIPVLADTGQSWEDRRGAIERGDADIMWICGLATVEALDSGRLDAEIVAAPVHEGRTRPTYHSVVIARRDSSPRPGDGPADQWLSGTRLAINGPTSWSGYHALRVHVLERGTPTTGFRSVTETGGHAASIEAVLADRADVAAIDDTIWRRWSERDPRVRDLVVVDRTREWPAPPFSVARALDERLRRAIADALLVLTPTGLSAIVPAVDADYDPIRMGMRAACDVPW